jgi:hypothetical protein
VQDGTDTTIATSAVVSTAIGGLDGQSGQAECFPGLGGIYQDGDGNGTGNLAIDSPCDPGFGTAGVGLSISQLSGLDLALFPAGSYTSDTYGSGGQVGPAATFLTASGSGGAVLQDADPAVDPTDAAGIDGLVILRFAAAVAPAAVVVPPVAPAAPSLAATGAAVPRETPGIAVALIAIGAVLRTMRRRTRT